MTEVSLELTILMPCLNEAETLAACLVKANRFLAESGVTGEIVVADNGSTDGSQDIARQHGARVVNVPVRGYGAALQVGIAAAKGRYVVMGDSDDSYDFSNLMPFLEKLRNGSALVMGNRFQGGIDDGAMPFLHRYLGNPVLSFIGRLFFGAPIGDFHCGLRGFDHAAILALELQTTGMEFASEMVVKATLNKLPIAEVPTRLAKDGRSRPPHLRTWRDGWRHLIFMLLHSPLWLFLIPGLLLLTVGATLMVLLLPGPYILLLGPGHIEFDVHTLVLSSAMVDVGTSTLLFWFLARQYAGRAGILPEPAWLKKLMSAVTLNRAIVLGVLLFAGGFWGILDATLSWRHLHFGELDYQLTLRRVVPSATLLIVGMQVIFFGFLSGLLSLTQGRK